MEKSIADSDPRAECSLVTWYLFGAYGLPCAPELALGHLERAAAGGVREAMYNLGVSFDLGKGVARDAHKAFFWYLKAGVRGDPEGVRQVANCDSSGSGVPKDVDSALVWYEWAEALGADEGDAADFRAWMKKNEPDPTRPSGGRGGRGRCPKR